MKVLIVVVTILVLTAFCISNLVFYNLGQLQPLAQEQQTKQPQATQAPGRFNHRNTCEEVARAVEEPFTSEYLPTNTTVDIAGTQWSFYKWTGVGILLEDIEKLAQSRPDFFLRFKILDGKLYFQEDLLESAVTSMKYRAKLLLSGIMMALVWFDIPDVDFVVDLGDFPANDPSPSLVTCSNNKTGEPSEGFTVPFDTAIENALGPKQMSTMLECLKERYPSGDRINKMVWRGSFRYETEGFNPRKELSFLVQKVQNLVDFGFVRYFLPENITCTQWADPTKSPNSGPCPQLAPGMVMESFNNYAFVMDVDGRGWSGRLSSLMKGNTPIVKQVSQFVDYSSVHLLEDRPVEFFKTDLSDFTKVAFESEYKRNRSPVEYSEAMVRRMHNFAQTHYTHFGVARAIAYSLTMYASKTTWTPENGGSFTRVPLDYYMIKTLPKEFLEKLYVQFG